ncbi:hypothetical protein ISTM_230 [Insectomime virus]|uniref:Uncharacterized protein n=1 Tax=Tunisvirus fontaine2 TaxID=1421067 RepID=V9SER7_9VIRU|nr:hypothetical protein D1R32_gp084 [Tunisvirus fontaine2]AHA46128.1 hypothetical protein ISTM_230 [Insectomime virus]AHC54801.1 hypothetical protein TNS_ORF83 [Tunisvirus fontaine2]
MDISNFLGARECISFAVVAEYTILPERFISTRQKGNPTGQRYSATNVLPDGTRHGKFFKNSSGIYGKIEASFFMGKPQGKFRMEREKPGMVIECHFNQGKTDVIHVTHKDSNMKYSVEFEDGLPVRYTSEYRTEDILWDFEKKTLRLAEELYTNVEITSEKKRDVAAVSPGNPLPFRGIYIPMPRKFSKRINCFDDFSYSDLGELRLPVFV